MTRPTPDDIAAVVQEIAEQVPELGSLVGAITAVRASHPEDWTEEIEMDEQNNLLVAYTKSLVNLRTNLAAYPVGYTTAILFDADGHPV